MKRGREYQGCEKDVTWKKGKEKQYNFPHNIEAIGENIWSGKGGEKIKIIKMGLGKNIKM